MKLKDHKPKKKDCFAIEEERIKNDCRRGKPDSQRKMKLKDHKPKKKDCFAMEEERMKND